MNQLKVALVYDWLDTAFGGAEYVLQTLIQAFPQAVLFTAKYDAQAQWTRDLTINTSFIDQLPLVKNWRPLTALCSPIAFESFNLSEFDVVISVTAFAAKGVLTRPNQVHISYILSPPRFVYRITESYLSLQNSLTHLLIRLIGQPFMAYLKRFDLVADYRPNLILPISDRVKNQITTTSGRPTNSVVYPPVRSQNIAPNLELQQILPFNYLLSVGRLVPYKMVDLAIASTLSTGKQLLIVGTGSDLKRLQQLADNTFKLRQVGESLIKFLNRADKAPILFLRNCEAQELATLYQKADALLALGEDDFGLTPLEAASVGTITILNEKSGVTEILNSQLAIHVDTSKLKNVIEAINSLANNQIDRDKLINAAEMLSPSKFISYWQSLVEHATNV